MGGDTVIGSIFRKAGGGALPLKVLIWGKAKTGKTLFALSFPSPAVVDLERGTVPYEDQYDFQVVNTQDPQQVWAAAEAVGKGMVSCETLVIDPITVYWQVLQDIGQQRAARKGRDFLSYYDWGPIKAPLKRLYTLLGNLPVHVVLTARAKPLYEKRSTGGREEEFVLAGEIGDYERSTEFVFDVILHTGKDEKGYYADVTEARDPTRRLVGQRIYDPSFEALSGLIRKGKQIAMEDPDEVVKQGAEVAERIGLEEQAHNTKTIQGLLAWAVLELGYPTKEDVGNVLRKAGIARYNAGLEEQCKRILTENLRTREASENTEEPIG